MYKSCLTFCFPACSRNATNYPMCNIYVVDKVGHNNWKGLLFWRCSWYHLFRVVMKPEFHSSNINMEDSPALSRSRKCLIHSLRNPENIPVRIHNCSTTTTFKANKSTISSVCHYFIPLPPAFIHLPLHHTALVPFPCL